MEVILLERVAKLGQMGEIVRVKDGYARNFLLPGNKALRATDGNKKRFEGQKAQLEARNLEMRTEAEKVGETLAGQSPSRSSVRPVKPAISTVRSPPATSPRPSPRGASTSTATRSSCARRSSRSACTRCRSTFTRKSRSR